MDQNKKIIIILIGVSLVAIVVSVLYGFGGLPLSFKSVFITSEKKSEEKPKVIEENLVIPETEKITGAEGRVVAEGPVEVPLVPKSEGEKVIVLKAVLTVKGSYDLATPEAMKWSSDSKLVFIKSLGAVTLEGKSSQWQLAFSSKTKSKKGYEVIIQADQIVSKKEIDSTAVGADVPKNFFERDASWAIKQLATNPQFQTASMSAITFTYNHDAKAWDYVIVNSFGNSAIRVR